MENLKHELIKCRSELENIREQLATLKETHNKDAHSLRRFLQGVAHGRPIRDEAGRSRQKALAAAAKEEGKALASCADGELRPRPIGYIESVFKHKNGTPRQANVCETSRALLTISADLFSNPEHSLENLGAFSHLWVIYHFHKNNNSYTKAKVAPPRLDGQRVGLFSTRSPYRPNAIGLSLVSIEKVCGATLHLSGVDMLDGTPVLDIKPYIPTYDMPKTLQINEDTPSGSEDRETDASSNVRDIDQFQLGDNNQFEKLIDCEGVVDQNDLENNQLDKNSDDVNTSVDTNPSVIDNSAIHSSKKVFGEIEGDSRSPSRLDSDNRLSDKDEIQSALSRLDSNDRISNEDENPSPPQNLNAESNESLTSSDTQKQDQTNCNTTETNIESQDVKFAKWVKAPPISKLDVIFTNRAESCLEEVTAELDQTPQTPGVTFISQVDLRQAIVSILSADPRSTYRRQKCVDRLYYFIVGQVHVTCWFDENKAEVIKLDIRR